MNLKEMNLNELNTLYKEIGQELEQKRNEQLVSLKEELRIILKTIDEVAPNYILINNAYVDYTARQLFEQIF